VALTPIELGGISPLHPFMMLLQRAEDAACRSADVVVSILPKADTHLVSRGMAQDKFVFIPNGIDPDEWGVEINEPLPAPHAEAIARARRRGYLLVGYAGSHGVANALGTALDAAALMREDPVTWLFVGGGPQKPALLKRVAAERLSNVIMLDPVPKAVIPALLRAKDILYTGLHRHSLFRFGINPNKLMDYMIAARPIVAVEAGNDPVGEAGCGLTVPPENAAIAFRKWLCT
jgi:glycosyltransferase involved in cell wall biosynthesis